jgi:retron-type reverse transcriptase
MGKTEVVDADLAKYFDTIPHVKLMRQVARRVSDGMILKLIKAWLRAPIAEEDECGGYRMKANTCGTPQGGVISPLLANIYLHPLDEAVNEQCREKPRMIRYADDRAPRGRSGSRKAPLFRAQLRHG